MERITADTLRQMALGLCLTPLLTFPKQLEIQHALLCAAATIDEMDKDIAILDYNRDPLRY